MFGVACFSEARYVFVGVCLDFVVVWFCRVCCFGFRWDRFLLCSWDSHVLKFCLDLVLSLVVAGVFGICSDILPASTWFGHHRVV